MLLTFCKLPANAYEFTICKDCKHTTIQPAIDAAWSGATIEVGKGVYEENLSIDRSITLKGAGKGKTIIKSPEKDKPVVSINSEESKVNIKGVTFIGAQAGKEKKEVINFASGVFIRGSDNQVTVKDSSMKDNDGWGIYLEGSNKLVANNLKLSANKQGGLFVTDDSIATVSNSALVNNKGNGMFAKGGQTIKLHSNSIAGNKRGVYFYGSPKIELKNNLIENNGSGILTYGDLFRGEVKGSGNTINGSVSPPLESGLWPEKFVAADLTFDTGKDVFPYDDIKLPIGLEFEYVKYDKLLGIERKKLFSDGPEVVLVWGKGKVDYVPDPHHNPVNYRPYVLNERGHLMGLDGNIPEKSHVFSIYFNSGYGWKPAFFVPTGAASKTHEEKVKVEVRDLIYSSSGDELMVKFIPSAPTNPIKRFLLNWTGDRLKVYHKASYDRYQSSESYEFNTYKKQRPVSTCFEVALHATPSSFCYKQFRFWDGDEYEILKEELTWWGFDYDADLSGNCTRALKELKEDFKTGLMSYRSDPLKLARHVKGRTNARYWKVFQENGLAIIHKIEGREKDRLFAYQPFYPKKEDKAELWVLTSENLYDKGKQLKDD